MLGRPALLKSALTLGVELMKPTFAGKKKKKKKEDENGDRNVQEYCCDIHA
jgi:hypothetical protein